MKLTEFVETYNESNAKTNAPRDTKELDRLFEIIKYNISKQCNIKTQHVPEFEIDIFGNIITIHGARIV